MLFLWPGAVPGLMILHRKAGTAFVNNTFLYRISLVCMYERQNTMFFLFSETVLHSLPASYVLVY